MSKRDLYVQACEAYQEGRPIMTDLEFDALERELRAEGHTDLTDKTHDEVSGSDIDDKTFSIRPMESWDEILSWVRLNIDQEFFATLKYDGVCAKIQDGREFKAQSRGRDTLLPWSYTEALRHVVPKNDEEILVVGEAFVPAKHLEFFKKKYNDDIYKLPRSAAVSLLRTPWKHDADDLRKLRFVAYRLDREFKKKSDMYDYMWSLGYDTPAYETFKITKGADIKQFLRDIFALVDSNDSDAPSDGIVLELNDLTIVPEVVQGKYLSTMIACKVDKWGELIHTGVVKGIIHTPKKGNFGCVLEIEPVILPDGVTQRRINAFNIGIVLREKIERGSVIRFRRKANGMSVLVYGKDYDVDEVKDDDEAESFADTRMFPLPFWVAEKDKKRLYLTLRGSSDEVKRKYIRRNFWTLVKAEFQRKECYADLERLRNLERYHRDTKVFYDLKTAATPSKNTYEWIKMLPRLEDYVEETLSYRDLLDENFSTLESEKNACTADSLRFWYDSFEHIGATDEGQFYYLPLMLWSLEDLFIYSKYSAAYSEDLLKFFVPVLRKHRIASNAFAALIEAEPKTSELRGSRVFNDGYDCIKEIEDNPSVGVDMFTSELKHALETGDFRKLDLAEAKEIRTKFPLYCMFRSLYVAEQMNVDDIYRYIVPTEVAVLLYRQCEIQCRTYTQQNIASLILSGVHEVMVRPVTDISLRNPAVWEGTVEIAQRAVKNLLEASIITPETSLAITTYLRKANALMVDCFHHGKSADSLAARAEFVLAPTPEPVSDKRKNETTEDHCTGKEKEKEEYEIKKQDKFLDLYWRDGVSDEEVSAAYEFFESRYDFIDIDELDYDPLHAKVRTVGGEFFGTFAYAMKKFKY